MQPSPRSAVSLSGTAGDDGLLLPGFPAFPSRPGSSSLLPWGLHSMAAEPLCWHEVGAGTELGDVLSVSRGLVPALLSACCELITTLLLKHRPCLTTNPTSFGL